VSTTPYVAGQAVRLPVQVKDPTSGLLVDPQTLALTVTLPDGTSVSHLLVDLTRLAAGSYEYVYTPPSPGHYGYRYVSTAPNGGLEGQFDVLPADVFTDAGQIFGWPGAYLTVPEFRAMPTGTNLDDLINNGSRAANDAELANILLRASRWCDNYCRVQLGAHRVVSERQHVQVQRDGTVSISPRQTSGGVPPVSCSRLAYGTPGTLTATVTPTSQWVEDGAFSIPLSGGGATSWSGPLQFGGPTSGRMAVEYDYLAGYPITMLAASATAAATSLAVRDATGIQPGQQLNIHDPGVEEQVTVTSSWVPVTGPASIPVAATQYAHSAGAGIGAMPEDVKTAVGQMAVVLIRRSSDTGSPSVDKSVGADMEAFQNAARAILDRYRRVAAD
jgi:hypothetical protein